MAGIDAMYPVPWCRRVCSPSEWQEYWSYYPFESALDTWESLHTTVFAQRLQWANLDPQARTFHPKS